MRAERNTRKWVVFTTALSQTVRSQFNS